MPIPKEIYATLRIDDVLGMLGTFIDFDPSTIGLEERKSFAAPLGVGHRQERNAYSHARPSRCRRSYFSTKLVLISALHTANVTSINGLMNSFIQIHTVFLFIYNLISRSA